MKNCPQAASTTGRIRASAAHPFVDGDRLWYVSSRGEVVCLDTEGFRDGENDGPSTMRSHGTRTKPTSSGLRHDEGTRAFRSTICAAVPSPVLATCLFVNTGNGVDEGHITIPEEEAPSFICVNRNSGKVLWTDNSPGANILHGQWSSPAYGVFDGVAKSYLAAVTAISIALLAEGKDGKPKLLWKFDCNPKASLYTLARATRNHLIATPVVYDGLVYIAVGEDPEHGEGQGHLWCIDPTKRGDVSPTIVYNAKDPKTPIAPKRLQAMDEKAGDFERENPNSAAVWHYIGERSVRLRNHDAPHLGTVAIKNDLLFVPTSAACFIVSMPKTGKGHWTYDMFAASWGSPLIVDDHVYIGDEDGDICIFKLSPEMELLGEVSMGSSVVATPVVANGTMFIANRNRIFAIKEGAKSESAK